MGKDTSDSLEQFSALSAFAAPLLLRPLPHELQCHPGRRAGIRELHFVGGNGRDDTALIGGSNKIWKRARLDTCVYRFCVFVHRVRSHTGD